MRQIGNLATEQEAQTFADYLLTRGVTSKLDKSADGVTIWIHEEDQLDRAREELASFRTNPNGDAYREAAQSARHLRQVARQREEQYRRSTVDMRKRWSGTGAAGQRPLTIALIVISMAVTFLSNFGRADTRVFQSLAMVRYSVSSQGALMRETDLRAIDGGQVWRLVTPIFLHGDPLHLLFNMYWLYALGGMIESRRGTMFLATFVMAAAVFSNVVQFYWSGPAIGMSGVVYALFGYIWMKSRYEPRLGLYVDPNTVFWLTLWFVVCMVPNIFPNVANGAHAGGLAAGIAIGFSPVLWRKLVGR